MSKNDDALDFNPFDGDFGEPGDRTLRDAMVKARKRHECTHCGGEIKKGETHRSRTDVICGDLLSYRWCALCCEAMRTELRELEEDHPCPSYPYESRAKEQP